MTKSQLKQFYVFAKLPYSEAQINLDELRKILLLELKSSGDYLSISNKKWSKHELIEFFDSPIDSSFDFEAFLLDYPWIRNLETIDKIPYNSYLLKMDFSDERFAIYAQTEGKEKEDLFLRTFRNRISAQEDYYAAALLLYKKCFSTTFQLKLVQEAKKLLFNRFSEIIALGDSNKMPQNELIKKAKYITDPGFYILMKEVANDDSDLLYQNIHVIHHIYIGNTVKTIQKIIAEQLTLNHDANCIEYLLRMRERLKNQENERGQTSHTEKKKKNTQLRFFFITSIIIGIIMIFNAVQKHKRETYFNEYFDSYEYKKIIEESNQDLDSAIRSVEAPDFKTEEMSFKEIAEDAKKMRDSLTLEEKKLRDAIRIRLDSTKRSKNKEAIFKPDTIINQ